jgi:hypothetical protein
VQQQELRARTTTSPTEELEAAASQDGTAATSSSPALLTSSHASSPPAATSSPPAATSSPSTTTTEPSAIAREQTAVNAARDQSATGIIGKMTDTRKRVKLYELNADRQWDDKGTGGIVSFIS